MFSPSRAASALGEAIARPAVAIDGLPYSDLSRSPAARIVSQWASEAGLFAFHFEHRLALEPPEAWRPAEAPAPSEATWVGGVLRESKYGGYRHDLSIASFHPEHRAKWGTHELCHALVGFGWRPDASPLFHATASRLAEIVPVALWYFLDEAYLRRCPDHVGAGALYRTRCAACERVAAADAAAPNAEHFLADAARFLDAELAAVRRSRRLGRPVPHHHATLNLASDGVAYAAAHARRLSSEAMARWVSGFAVEGGGWSASLDDLEDRVVAVAEAIMGGPAPAPLTPSAAHGRARWTLQDHGMRLLSVWSDCDGEAAQTLLTIVDSLGEACRQTTCVDPPPHIETVLSIAKSRYTALSEAFVLPPADDVFAVGYGDATALGQLARGVTSALPATSRGLENTLAENVARFATSDTPERTGIGRRFSAWMAKTTPSTLAEVARFEGATTHPLAGDGGVAAALGSSTGIAPWRLSEGAEVLTFTCDPTAIQDALLAGAPLPVTSATKLVCGLGSSGTTVVPCPTGEQISTTADLSTVGDGLLRTLIDAGLAQPSQWSECRTSLQHTSKDPVAR